MELAALTRAFGPQDVAHDPVNAKGEPVRQKSPVIA
jgi:hypothetical protein